MANDHSDVIREIQDLVSSWKHDQNDDYFINAAIIAALPELVEKLQADDCPYTMSHTRHWCGNSRCRES